MSLQLLESLLVRLSLHYVICLQLEGIDSLSGVRDEAESTGAILLEGILRSDRHHLLNFLIPYIEVALSIYVEVAHVITVDSGDLFLFFLVIVDTVD